MAPTLWLLMSLLCAALGASSPVPVMQFSAQEPSADDPYDDEITIIAEPFIPYLQGFSSDASNIPNVRAGLTQQTSSNYFWPFWPSNTGSGLLSNKPNLGNLGSFWQNLQSLPLTVNVPNTVNGVNNQFSNHWNRWQQFLNLAQQNAAQWQASLQNNKGDQYYQYGLPSHPILYQLAHPYGTNNGYYKSIPLPEEDNYAPAYQVIAIMPMYNSPPVKVADLLRQRSLGYEKPQSDERPSGMEQAVESNIEKTVEKEVKKNLKDDMKEIGVFEEKDLKNFASGVAKEVASAVAVAAKNPGKVTEVMVRVDAKTDDDDDDDSSSSSSSSSEEDTPVANKKDGDKKMDKMKDDSDSDSDSDSSDSSNSSDSSDSTETSTTASGSSTTQKQKTPVKNGSEEGGQSSEDSDEMDSVEKIAKQALGSRPVKAELVKPTTTAVKH